MRKPTIWVLTRSDTNRAVQSQKMVRGLKFWIYVEAGFHYPCSENKGADQLRSYCEADLRLCFCLCRLLIFPCAGSNMYKFRQEVTNLSFAELMSATLYFIFTIIFTMIIFSLFNFLFLLYKEIIF